MRAQSAGGEAARGEREGGAVGQSAEGPGSAEESSGGRLRCRWHQSDLSTSYERIKQNGSAASEGESEGSEKESEEFGEP